MDIAKFERDMALESTPRTNGLDLSRFEIGCCEEAVCHVLDFARQLERELNKATHDIESYKLSLEILKQYARKVQDERDALLEYAHHRPSCPMPASKCDCGLGDLLDKLNARHEESHEPHSGH